MIGDNLMRLNEATVCAAIQEYLDRRSKEPLGSVTSVAPWLSSTEEQLFDVRLISISELDAARDATEAAPKAADLPC